MQYKNYIFDCDGVLLDSNSFKISAMRSAVKNYPHEIIDSFIEYFRKNFGKSRYHHIDILFENHLQRSAADGEKQIILEHYAQKCRDEYLTCKICAGAIELLERSPSTNCWVVSGSDQAELREVFAQRGLTRYFSGVYGSPTTKAANIRNILESQNLDRGETCLIGDASGDYQAAMENGIGFIFCSGYSNTPELADEYSSLGYKTVKTLFQITPGQ